MRKNTSGAPDYSLYALGLVVFFSLLQAIRWSTLPQFIDDFYHLLVAQNFVRGGGWMGWDFFEYAPFGRPHLYPPVYHFILSFFLKSGIEGILLIKCIEITIVPLFFLVLWKVTKDLFSPTFAFFSVLLSGSYFHFFIALTSNIPATLGLVLGLIFYLGIYRKDYLLSFLSLTLCGYTHTGVFFSFFAGAVIFALLERQYRTFLVKILGVTFLAYSPFLVHQLRFLNSIQMDIRAESRFTHVNLAVLACGLWGVLLTLKKKGMYSLTSGFILGSLIAFFKYFYRYFSAQGFLGWALASSALFEHFLARYKNKFWAAVLILFFLMLSPTLTMDNFKFSFRLADSTFANFALGKTFSVVPFNTVFSRKYYAPVRKMIRENSSEQEIIVSNIQPASVLFAALTGRLTADGLFFEVRPQVRFDRFALSRIIVWIKALPGDEKEVRHEQAIVKKYRLQKMFENEVCSVYRNPGTDIKISINKSDFPLCLGYGIIGLGLGLIIWRLLAYSGPTISSS